jgi:putative acetyltransferase
MNAEEPDWEIRPCEPSDTGAIRELLLNRFGSSSEADLVEELRHGGHAEVELVASSEGRLLGYVLLSRMEEPEGALGLGPVATAPGMEGRGIASSLIESSLALATANDWQLVFLLGDHKFYERFGFSVEDAASFASPYAGPHWQVTFLDDEAPRSGIAAYAPPFAKFE